MTEDLQRWFPLTPASGGSALLLAPLSTLSRGPGARGGSAWPRGPPPTLRRSLGLSSAALARRGLSWGVWGTERGYCRRTLPMLLKIQQKRSRLLPQRVTDPVHPRGTPFPSARAPGLCLVLSDLGL